MEEVTLGDTMQEVKSCEPFAASFTAGTIKSAGRLLLGSCGCIFFSILCSFVQRNKNSPINFLHRSTLVCFQGNLICEISTTALENDYYLVKLDLCVPYDTTMLDINSRENLAYEDQGACTIFINSINCDMFIQWNFIQWRRRMIATCFNTDALQKHSKRSKTQKKKSESIYRKFKNRQNCIVDPPYLWVLCPRIQPTVD